MLQPFIPVPAVDRPVQPVHLSVADLNIVRVVAFVLAARLPGELAVTVLLITLVLPLVLVAIIAPVLLPVALSVLLPIVELAGVFVAVAPHVLAEAFSLAVLVLANVGVSDGKVIASLSMP